MRVAIFSLVVCACAVPAAAQSTYVGAALVGDIARFDKVAAGGGSPRILAESPVDDEAIG